MKFTLVPVLLVLILCSQLTLQGQAPKFLPKNAHKMTGEELKGLKISPTLPSYTEEGQKLDQLMMRRMSSSPEVGMDLYGDKDGNIVAIVFRAATERERAFKMKRLTARAGPGEWKDKELPEVKMINMDWEKLRISDFKGSVVALNFWFIGCKPCIMEMPELNRLVDKYKNEDVKFIAIGLDSRNKLIPFLQGTKFNYDVVPDARKVAKTFEISGYPTHLIIDKKGKVQFFQRGYNGSLSMMMDKKIEELLKEESK